ncbi:hypothetical protein PR202_gb21543 [Eleusine coracana subsp. coracana]|uniref:Histone deacetylase domain-containing protein n=1 Tax=Eleusine coracana subsp. coracana TaxID=191504 RepID=A0AAV5FDX1_ELECO|nr:hypothetical protein PR202_gb21543 [Eleusine coracana subsp. coracana]
MAAAARAPPTAAARVGLLYDERMCAHATPDGEDHPEKPDRLRSIWRKLNAEGVASRYGLSLASARRLRVPLLDSRCVALKAKEAKDKYIASVHSQNHIKLMKDISSKKYDSSRDKIARKFNSIYFNKGSSESALLAAGSVIEVAEKVASGELNSAIALVRPPGHHAEHGEAMGFCLFNNVAVAASYLLNERPDLGIKKILIVDWDVHHGNGTQKMFYKDPRVLFFSVHRFDYGTFYPAEGDASHCFIGEEAGKGYNINVPWEHGKCGDADYIAAWDHVLLPVAEAFDPDMILVSAGFDAALGDPLGGCCITPNGYALLLTKLYASSGSESDIEDVDELYGTVSSVDVTQAADDVLGERLLKMKLDEDNLAMKSISSGSSVEQLPSDSVEEHSKASVFASKRIADLSFTWRSVSSRIYVWYASFGSNMWKPRFLCYIQGGKDSWYSNVLYLGKEDDLPILTMTCPSSDIEKYTSGELPLAPPSKTYAATLIRGLVEGKQLDAVEAAGYINSAAARVL